VGAQSGVHGFLGEGTEGFAADPEPVQQYGEFPGHSHRGASFDSFAACGQAQAPLPECRVGPAAEHMVGALDQQGAQAAVSVFGDTQLREAVRIAHGEHVSERGEGPTPGTLLRRAVCG
jgi:hypothetical protein